MNMRHKGIVMALAGMSGVVRQYRKGMAEMVQIQSAIGLLRLVRGIRGVTVIVFQYLFCGIFALTGLILSHVALFLWVREGFSPAVFILLMLGLFQIGAVLGFVIWLLSAKRWLHEAARLHPYLKKIAAKQQEEEG